MTTMPPSGDNHPRRRAADARMLAVALGLTLFPALPALAQPTFSIDWQGPPKGVPDFCTPVPITEGDILLPPFGLPAPGPLPPPCVFLSGGFGPPPPGLGMPLHPAAIGLPPGLPGMVELDALSYGMDPLLWPDHCVEWITWSFSVDEFAVGIFGTPIPPAVWTEGAFGTGEASADVYASLVGTPLGPVPPGLILGNTAVIDGDGLAPFGGPGVGIPEPNPPTPGTPFNPGGNLDGLDMDTFLPLAAVGPVYFSLDSGVFDPIDAFPNTASGPANFGVSGATIMVVIPGGIPAVYAPAPALGLDLAGFDTDDVDALVLWESGDGVFTPSFAPYDWVIPVPGSPGASDMLLFSVRRGSAIIGAPDSLAGVPIEPGDILMPPVFGAVTPAIFVPAETLGLATLRGGFATFGPFGDELDALDVVVDCNGNGISDSVDVLSGLSLDANLDRIPDECCVGVLRGDSNCDGVVNFFDIDLFLVALFTPGSYLPSSFCPNFCTVDVDCNGVVNFFDITPFSTCLFGPCPPCICP